jgi:deoxyribonuclease V
MEQKIKHPWSLSAAEAWQPQGALAHRVIRKDQFAEVQLVAGVDVAYQAFPRNYCL